MNQSPAVHRRLARLRLAGLGALVAVLSACGGGDATPQVPAEPPPTTLGKALGTVEIDITGLGTAKPGSAMRWDGTVQQKQAQGLLRTAAVASPSAAIAATSNLPAGLDIEFQSASSIDTGGRPGGTRYISVTYRVRNAQFSGTPGSGAAYTVPRSNLTFLAVIPSTGINATAITRFVRFDNSAADPALALQLVPTHGMNSTATAVEAGRASMQVYRESELPTADASVTDVLPYGFVVNNVNDGSRTLPASPAAGQFDGLVTFAFKLPLQATAELDPFKISLRFQVMEDSNTRVTQSLEDVEGDTSARAAALGTTDIAALCDRPLSLPLSNPICSVRLAGPAASPGAYLTSAALGSTLKVISSPNNLASMGNRAEIVLATSQLMNAPTVSTLVVNGSQSGRRTLTGVYAGVLDGGGSSSRPNQLVFRFGATDKPFFPGETVSFTATAGNTSTGGAALPAFVGRYMVTGSTPGAAGSSASGTFAAASALTVAAKPQGVALGDFNGDGRLDVATATNIRVSVRLGNAAGGLDAAVNYTAGFGPQDVAAVDVDGDGKLDIVVLGSSARNTVLVLKGDGTGKFAAPVTISLGPAYTGIAWALGDINGDGRMDVVMLTAFSPGFGSTASLLVPLLGNASGGLTRSADLTVAGVVNPALRNITLADFNGDGKLDLALAGDTMGLYLGDGAGRFGTACATVCTPNSSHAASAAPTGLATGDVNGDGRLDLVVTHLAGGKVYVLLGNGAGGFATAVAYDTGAGPNQLALADVTGDGRLDIVVVNTGDSTVAVLLNTGSGTFLPAVPYAVGASASGLAVGDVNGDGKLDLLVGSSGTAATELSLLPGQ